MLFIYNAKKEKDFLIKSFSFTSTLNIEKTSDYRFSTKFILPIILSEELPIRAVNFPGSAIH